MLRPKVTQWLQCILLTIHQYRTHIIYKPGPDIYIVDWLSRQNNAENKDGETAGMQLRINAIDATTNIPAYLTIQHIQEATLNDIHLKDHKVHFTYGSLPSIADVQQNTLPNWTLRQN